MEGDPGAVLRQGPALERDLWCVVHMFVCVDNMYVERVSRLAVE
jgi:hypothetical protein